MKKLFLGTLFSFMSFCVLANDVEENDEGFIIGFGDFAYNIGTDLVGFADAYVDLLPFGDDDTDDDEDMADRPSSIEQQKQALDRDIDTKS